MPEATFDRSVFQRVEGDDGCAAPHLENLGKSLQEGLKLAKFVVHNDS
jgi:hypothetical protein